MYGSSGVSWRRIKKPMGRAGTSIRCLDEVDGRGTNGQHGAGYGCHSGMVFTGNVTHFGVYGERSIG